MRKKLKFLSALYWIKEEVLTYFHLLEYSSFLSIAAHAPKMLALLSKEPYKVFG